MLFAKLLGRLRGKTPQPKSSVNNPPSARRAQPTSSADGAGSGFDPYNSGTFKSAKAWERINRR